jgi:hypothetical protein
MKLTRDALRLLIEDEMNQVSPAWREDPTRRFDADATPVGHGHFGESVLSPEEVLLEQFIKEALEEEKKASSHPPEYDAPEGSKRDEKLDAAKAAYKRGDVEKAVQIRKSMEKKEREKQDKKDESVEELRTMIREIISEALSAKVKATLRKKAQKRGLTPGSVYAEYRKGLAAWVSSGSRKGMSQHQWAMARVNSANPSKSWAVVKKSKAKKK